jgi:hypothetical protein
VGRLYLLYKNEFEHRSQRIRIGDAMVVSGLDQGRWTQTDGGKQSLTVNNSG